jgi:hypothetical protein
MQSPVAGCQCLEIAKKQVRRRVRAGRSLANRSNKRSEAWVQCSHAGEGETQHPIQSAVSRQETQAHQRCDRNDGKRLSERFAKHLYDVFELHAHDSRR